MVYGPAVSSVLVSETSAWVVASPALPLSSVLFWRFGSCSAAPTVTALSNTPAALIVAVTAMFSNPPPPLRKGIVQGNDEQDVLVTFVIVRFAGVSVTWMFVAFDGPPFDTVIV
jgi:hypothetical protein